MENVLMNSKRLLSTTASLLLAGLNRASADTVPTLKITTPIPEQP
jgi:hypothetical protein